MASPRFVAAPQVRDYASEILSIYDEGFRRKMLAAERAGDEQYARDSAEYAARVTFATEQLKAAQKEVLAARNAVASLDVKDAQGAAQAAKTIAELNRSKANASMLATAVGGKGGAADVPDHIRTDPSDDKILGLIHSSTRWDTVQPDFTENDENPKYADREMLDRAAAAVAAATAGESVSPGVKKVLVVGWLEAHGEEPSSASIGTLREAAVREALLESPHGTEPVLTQIQHGANLLNKDGKERNVSVGAMMVTISGLVDEGSKDGNTPAEAAGSVDRAEAAKHKGGGAKAAANKAKAETLDAELANPDQFRPDYDKTAKPAAAARLAQAESDLAGVEFPTPEQFLDRISRTRNVYAGAYGAGTAKVTPAPATPPVDIDALIAEARRTAAKATPRPSPQATTPEATKTMEEADKIIAEPAPPVHPAIPLLREKGLYDAPTMELPEMDMSGVPVADAHRDLLQSQGLIARSGAVRKNRAAHLAATTSEGRQAKAALEDASGDLTAALAKLKSDKSKAIAVGLAA